ncbi:hypothetical protein LEMLEM_LOCUS27318 [Lemmus lemmus]
MKSPRPTPKRKEVQNPRALTLPEDLTATLTPAWRRLWTRTRKANMSKSPTQAALRKRKKSGPCWQRTPTSLTTGRTKDNEGSQGGH